ncbi:hypothetical protein [Lewinella sp. IMCC34183]|uniref:hypothetical protein n=1 Tax=Lewinella sp. IMCC34183 TaxID=2248762 RepID=UPI000E238285|nr:hypothetical protein [Lewinella sp. IMCC34183]
MSTNHSTKPGSDTFMGRMDAGRFVAGASSIVSRAVDILEENLAEGIVVAKRLERKVIDVEQARGTDDQAVMNRFRKDAHEALDIFFDALSTATHSLNTLVERVAEAQPSPPPTTAAKAPVLSPETPLAAGEKTEIPLRLENDNREREMVVEFRSADLTTPEGTALRGRNIRFSPKKLRIPPGGRGEMTVLVTAPKRAAAGRYSGFIEDKSIAGLRATLVVDIST